MKFFLGMVVRKDLIYCINLIEKEQMIIYNGCYKIEGSHHCYQKANAFIDKLKALDLLIPISKEKFESFLRYSFHDIKDTSYIKFLKRNSLEEYLI